MSISTSIQASEQLKIQNRNFIQKVINAIYSVYALVIFLTSFFALYPFFLIFIQKVKWHRYGILLNRIWSWIFFNFCGIKVEIEYKSPLDKNKQYVFCANHFSFLDIALMGRLPFYFVFVGKSSLGKVPFFGYMFKKLHITVNRESIRNKYESLVKSKQAIEVGKSIAIFPEGGITKNAPNLSKFKDGAFRLAIEKQVPVVPITLPYNYIIFPDEKKLQINRRKAKIVVHEEISTLGLTLDDIDQIKEKTFNIIEKELKKHN
jgi:1-acyl-sn-glycerol-3-phosphate acyltransferase